MAAAQRAQFRLKLRLLVEPDVVVADVPAVTSERRPEGRVPERLAVRVVAGQLDDATKRRRPMPGASASTTCARCTSASAPGTSPSSASRSTTSPQDGKLGDAMLAYARRLTDDPTVGVNVVLPERIDTSCTACGDGARSRSSGACSSSRT